MKQIPQALADRFAGESLTLCHCWRLTRQDGFVVRLTDHDQDVLLEGETYSVSDTLRPGVFQLTAGLQPGRAAAEGALSSDFIQEADLAAGLWDRTEIGVVQVDWTRPDLGSVAVWSGYISEVQVTESGQFEAELVSLKADFERLIGRVFTRRCGAILGDEQCQADTSLGPTCDKTLTTCRDVFGNAENFRGFPHMPGPDFILAGPAASGNDGGKR